MGIAAFIALPSVVLMMMFGQTRIFFVMARDGLLPEKLASVHPKFKTPHVVTAFTGIVVTLAAAFLPVGKLADYSNSGTLFAFAMVALAVMVLRRTNPDRRRPFRTPAVYIVAPAAIIGCVGLYLFLPFIAKMVLIGWGAIGLLVYFGYSRSRSYVGRGIFETHELDPDAPPQPVPPMPGAHTPGIKDA
jgi:APA family basic amino acid/polyamine antiporter